MPERILQSKRDQHMFQRKEHGKFGRTHSASNWLGRIISAKEIIFL